MDEKEYHDKLLGYLLIRITSLQHKSYELMVSGDKFHEGRYSACEDIGSILFDLMNEKP